MEKSRLSPAIACVLVAAAMAGAHAQQSPPPPARAVSESSAGKWVINFKDTDIQTVISRISEITGNNYIMAPGVTGKVNVVSQVPLTADEINELLLSVLYMHGFTITPSGASLVVRATDEAKKNRIPVDAEGSMSGQAYILRVLPVKYANINEIMQAVQPLVSDFAVLRNLPDANALLIADKADNVRKVSEIMAQLDSPEAAVIETVRLSKNWVGSVMPLLEKLAPREMGVAGKPAISPLRIVGDERNNMIILKGDADARARMRALIEQFDQSANEGDNIQVLQLHNVDAVKTAEILKDMFAPAPGQTAPPVSIKASAMNNAIIVHAKPDTIEQVQRVLSQLDVRREQVLIEAAIVEVSDDLIEDLGIQFGAGDAAIKSSLVATSLPTGGVSLAGALDAADAANSGLVSSGLTGAIGWRHGFSALIKALASTTRANLLSTPSITTVNNEEARIVVGQNVPFRTGSFDSGAGGGVNPFTTIQRQDIGVTLKVTPQINAGGRVMLKVEQEVSSLQDTAVEGAADIITNKRTISTTVMAENGQTIVLGGLISNDKTTVNTKVPFLGDIPVLGLLFQADKETNNKRNLLVFLRPTVLGDDAAVESANLRKYNGIWELRLGPEAREHPLTAGNVRSEMEKIYAPDLSKPSGKFYLPWLHPSAGPKTQAISTPRGEGDAIEEPEIKDEVIKEDDEDNGEEEEKEQPEE